MSAKDKNYYEHTKDFTEEDFKNPTKEMKNNVWWKLAYTDWADANGMMKTINTKKDVEEFIAEFWED